MQFNGQRVLVTGAGKGIGRCIVKQLAANGARPIALSRTAADLDSLNDEVPGLETVVCDLSDWERTREVVRQLGDIDLLVNNAGVMLLEPTLEVSPDVFDKLYNIHVKAVLNVSQLVAGSLISRQKAGSIVHLSSLGSKRAYKNSAIYCGSKGALDAMMRVMAVEWGPHQVRVNCVNPTLVNTEMTKGLSEEATDRIKSRIPQNKFASEEDVANAVLFLLSDKSDMINGTALAVDGGALVS